MNADLAAKLRDLARDTIAHYGVPGLVIAVRADGAAVGWIAEGTDAAGTPLGWDSLFPVASLSKLATALSVLRLADAGALRVDDPLVRYLPGAASAQPGVTLRRLLSHSSGLPLDLPNGLVPYDARLGWPQLSFACQRTPLERPPATRVQYSNVGYGVLAGVVERVTGQVFREALRDLVLSPLQVEGYLGDEPPRPSIALADVRSGFVRTELEPFNTPFWRQLALPWGGLLTTADGALRLLWAFETQLAGFLGLAASTDARQNQNDDLAGGFVQPLIWPRAWWGLGPDLRDTKNPHWTPSDADPLTYGHTGESGALAYRDPAAGVSWTILGSRTAYNGWLLRAGPSIGTAVLDR
jgi:beta-lactamase class C